MFNLGAFDLPRILNNCGLGKFEGEWDAGANDYRSYILKPEVMLHTSLFILKKSKL